MLTPLHEFFSDFVLQYLYDETLIMYNTLSFRGGRRHVIRYCRMWWVLREAHAVFN